MGIVIARRARARRGNPVDGTAGHTVDVILDCFVGSLLAMTRRGGRASLRGGREPDAAIQWKEPPGTPSSFFWIASSVPSSQ